jgi:replicative DNA helicase
MAKTYGVVIAVSQIDATGEGQEYLTMNQLRGSKTDKAGEADAIITIGRSNDPAKRHSRFIHVPKNKLLGGPHSREEYRHGYFEVTIKPEIGRYITNMKGK